MNTKLLILVVVALAFGLASCKKTDDAPPEIETTNLNVINATADTLNFYLNGTRINNSSSLYPLGSSGYIDVAFGEQNYEFKKPRSPVVLFSLPLTLDTLKSYSLYIAGNTAEQTFSTIDTLAADTNRRAKIRFVNASPDAGSLDVMVGDTVKFKTRAFKTSTVFLPVNAGMKRIRISMLGSVKIDETRELLAGRIYTLFTKGSLSGTGNAAFATGLVINN